MENQLTTIEKLPLSEMLQISKLFAESGMFADTKTQSQAIVKIMAGAELGLPAFASMSGIHIIQGKPTIGAGLIASRVKGSGKYDYKVIEQTEEKCIIDFYQGKDKIGTSTFTLADAKKAATKNMDKFPRNMLFARAISNGVKWYCPDVFSGPVYVPEEMDQTIDIPHEVVKEGTTTVMQPTPQPIIDNHVHAVNAIKKNNTPIDLLTTFNRMTPETQNHPSVVDQLVSEFFKWIEACDSRDDLQLIWTAIGKYGKEKEFQKNEAILEKVKNAKMKITEVKPTPPETNGTETKGV